MFKVSHSYSEIFTWENTIWTVFSLSIFEVLGRSRYSWAVLRCANKKYKGTGGRHFVYGASPQHILLHFPIKLFHFPIKFASFPQQTASFPQEYASFPQQIVSFPHISFSLPQHLSCHFAKHRIKYTLVAFVWLLSTVRFQMYLQIDCLDQRNIYLLITFEDPFLRVLIKGLFREKQFLMFDYFESLT